MAFLENLDKVELFLSFLVTVFGLLISTFTFLLKSVKNGKAKQIAQQILNVTEAMIPYIEQAEKFLNYSGEEKKAYVITRIKEYAIENKIKIDNDFIDKKIEEFVELTNKVNALKPQTAKVLNKLY